MRTEVSNSVIGGVSDRLVRSLLHSAPDIVVWLGPGGELRYANQALTRVLGYRADDLLGRPFAELLHPDDLAPFHETLDRVAANLGERELEVRVRHRDDDWRWLGTTASQLADDPDEGIVLTARDITLRRQMDEALRDRQVRLEMLGEIASGIRAGDSVQDVVARAVKRIYMAFPDLRVVYSTVDAEGIQTVVHVAGPPGTPDVAGLTADLSIAPDYLAALRGTEPIVVPDMARDPRFAPLTEALTVGGTRAGIDVPLQHSEYIVGTLCFDSPEPRDWTEHEVATLTEVAAYLKVALAEVHAREGRRRMEQALRQNEARFRSLVQHSWDIILVLGPDRVVQYASQSIERTLGYAPDEVVGAKIVTSVHPDDLDLLDSAIEDCLRMPAANPHVEVRVRHRDGSWRNVEIVATNLINDLNVGAIVLNARDITQRKVAEHALTYQAFHDQLTGLPNRALLTDRLGHALKSSARHGEPIALLFVDLDRFKLVNDSLGHEAGDELIVAAAIRLQNNIRASDTLARFGGDEFVAILEGCSVEEAGLSASRLLEAFRQPFVVSGYETTVSACIGIAVSTPEHNHSADLLRAADVALYEAKRRGGNVWVAFEPEMDVTPQNWFVLETELRRAIARSELVLHYQPIIEIETGRFVAVEALIRWKHPERGMVPPIEFLPIAEETGLMVPIGAWVVAEACRDLAAWRRRDGDDAPLAVSVNLSTSQLRDPGLVGEVSRSLLQNGLSGRALILEVTEHVLMEDLRATEDALKRIRALGVRLAIDDFGAGSSSLAHMRELSADVLKLDRALVHGIDLDGSRRAVVRAVTGLAHAFGMHVVAEGIENSTQQMTAGVLKCDWGQGYHIARPMAAADLAAFRPARQEQRA